MSPELKQEDTAGVSFCEAIYNYLLNGLIT